MDAAVDILKATGLNIPTDSDHYSVPLKNFAKIMHTIEQFNVKYLSLIRC